MTDKVQKIREEVQRLQDLMMDRNKNFYSEAAEGEYNALCNIEHFIDSLQEEPVSESLNIESMIESYKQRLISQANGVKNSPLISMCLTSYKHGINETLNTLNLFNVERTVKNWREPVSEDLEEAADSYIKTHGEILGFGRQTFKAGAKWQKEQMMKGATDVTVHVDAGGYPYIPQMELYDYDKDVPLAKEGDKYKVILIKED